MTKADFFMLGGFACLTIGAALIYAPLAWIVVGVAFFMLAASAAGACRPKKPSQGAE